MQDVVDQMRSDLNIDSDGPVMWRVSYLGREPVSTMRVAQEIASAFINESLVDRSALTAQTNEFLESAAEDARRRLVEREQRLVAYRLAHSGELPTQVNANMGAMANASAQLQSNAQAVSTARQRQIFLERELSAAKDPSAPLPVAPAPAPGRAAGPPPSTTLQDLAEARRQLELVRTLYTAIHPDVRRWTSMVNDLEAKAAAEGLRAPAADLPAGVTPAEAARLRRIDEVQQQLTEVEKQLADAAVEEQRLRAEFEVYKARLEAAPKREAELTELMRDYGEIHGSYTELRRKSEDAMLASNLARREIGEQFKLLEPATVPTVPFSPDRQRITLFGMLAGLAMGVAVIGLLEYRDSTFKTDRQVATVLGLPVLAVVPVMRSDRERRRGLVLKVLLHLGLGTAVAGALVVVALTFLS
jgi:uncharacterized protein involved in exopolysaccharide biosynthesis